MFHRFSLLLPIAFACISSSIAHGEEELLAARSKNVSKKCTPPPQSEAPKVEPCGTSVRRTSRVQAGADYTRLHFVPKGSSSFNGNLGGLQGLYEYRPLNNVYTGLRVAYKQGHMRSSSSSDKRTVLYIDTQERLGYTTYLERQKAEVSFYTGIGYHHMGQELSASGFTSLDFGYNQFYVPLGFAFENQLTSFFSFGINGTWMPQVFTVVSIDPLEGAYWTLTRTFANFHLEVPLGFSLDDKGYYHIFFTPFFEYWQDGSSFAETTTGIPLGLPGNTYYFGGFDLNFSYSF